MIPFFGWASVLVGWIIVRQNPRQAKRQLGKAARYAAAGGLVHLSAEGQRSVDGSLSEYKKGPAVMAIEAQVPVYPTYIIGGRDRMPVGEWKIRRGKVICKLMPGIPTTGLTYDDRNELLQKIRAVGESEHAKHFTDQR